MGDFLGTGRVADNLRKFINYEKLKKIVRKYKVNSISEYRNFCKNNSKLIKQLEIPKYPNSTYKNKEWISWGNFLGTGRVADQFKKALFFKFSKAKKYVHNLKKHSF
jgi:hypothetical protein